MCLCVCVCVCLIVCVFVCLCECVCVCVFKTKQILVPSSVVILAVLRLTGRPSHGSSARYIPTATC